MSLTIVVLTSTTCSDNAVLPCPVRLHVPATHTSYRLWQKELICRLGGDTDVHCEQQRKSWPFASSLPSWRSEHRSERPRSRCSCCAQLSACSAATLSSLAVTGSPAGGQRERACAHAHKLSAVTRQRVLPRVRGESRRGAHAQSRAAVAHRSRSLGPVF